MNHSTESTILSALKLLLAQECHRHTIKRVYFMTKEFVYLLITKLLGRKVHGCAQLSLCWFPDLHQEGEVSAQGWSWGVSVGGHTSKDDTAPLCSCTEEPHWVTFPSNLCAVPACPSWIPLNTCPPSGPVLGAFDLLPPSGMPLLVQGEGRIGCGEGGPKADHGWTSQGWVWDCPCQYKLDLNLWLSWHSLGSL